jgi:hypothetical protein
MAQPHAQPLPLVFLDSFYLFGMELENHSVPKILASFIFLKHAMHKSRLHAMK